FGHEPQVASHDAVAKPKAAVEHELAAHDRDDPHLAAEADIAGLKPVTEERDLAAEFEIRICVQQVEARGGRTGQHVLADACQQRTLQSRFAVLAESGDVELDDRSRSTVGSEEGLVAAGSDETIDSRF